MKSLKLAQLLDIAERTGSRFGIAVLLSFFSTSAVAQDFELQCSTLPDIPTDLGLDYGSDIELPQFRIEYRSPIAPLHLEARDGVLIKTEGLDNIRKTENQLISVDTQGRIWTFTSAEFPDGVVLYQFDGIRNVLLRVNLTFTYDRGPNPPDESGKSHLSIYLYRCIEDA